MDAPTRVVLVSARPMFRRTFGKLLGALRDDIVVVETAALDDAETTSPHEDDAPRESLIVLDAGDATRETIARDVGEAVGPDGARRVTVVLDETDDALADAAMAAGAAGVMVKSVPPGVLAEWLDALLDGARVRPAPSVALAPETLSESLRARLSARRQKLLRLQMGGASIGETARALGMTRDKVVAETRLVMDIVRGRDGDA